MGIGNIVQDHKRFEEIIKRDVRKNLKKFITSDEFIGKRGDEVVRIPIKHIDIPRFVFERRQLGGVGQGDGNIGDSLGRDLDNDFIGPAGMDPGSQEIEAELTPDELTDMLIEFLQLPLLEPKGKRMFESYKQPLKSIGRSGSRVKFKRTFSNALRRQLASGTYDPDHPMIVPARDDFRYMIPKSTLKPEANAVIVYMLDVSGSMGESQRRLCKITNYWLEQIIKKRYQQVDERYVVHDVVAREVSAEEFYRTKSGGGTKLSSAYEKFMQIVDQNYPSGEWNMYPFHYSDGDNFEGDNDRCISILEKHVLKVSNMFCYGQCVNGPGDRGDYIDCLVDHFRLDPKKWVNSKAKVRVAALNDDAQIIPTIGKFLK